MERICIYHGGSCADGFGAAYAVWRKYPDITLFEGKYGEAPPEVDGKEVIIVDFSYPLPVLTSIIERARNVIILDHHKTAMDDIMLLLEAQQVHGGFDLNTSGAVLAWEYFHPAKPVPALLIHIQDRDLWRFEYPATKAIMMALFSYEMKMGVWDLLMRQDTDILAEQGYNIMRYYDKCLHDVLAATRRMENIGGFSVPVANVPYFMASDAGHIMCEGHPFAATYYDSASHRNWSLRSTDAGLDVSEIAKSQGGGGHRNAAGFRVAL